MKIHRISIFILALALAGFLACGKSDNGDVHKPEPEPTVVPTPEPSPEPIKMVTRGQTPPTSGQLNMLEEQGKRVIDISTRVFRNGVYTYLIEYTYFEKPEGMADVSWNTYKVSPFESVAQAMIGLEKRGLTCLNGTYTWKDTDGIEKRQKQVLCY